VPGIFILPLKGPYQLGGWTSCFTPITKYYFLHKYFLTLSSCIQFSINSQDRFEWRQWTTGGTLREQWYL